MLRVSLAALCAGSLVLSGCGTMTGIPAHGGGKRFATEQKLVAAAARATLKKIDVSPLVGRKVFVLYTVINDQGAGSMNGGRMTLAGLLQSAAAVAPATVTANKMQMFDLQSNGTNYSNAAGASSSTAVGQVITTGTMTSTGATNGSFSNSGSDSGTQNSSNSGSQTTGAQYTSVSGSNSQNSTSTDNGTSNGSSVSSDNGSNNTTYNNNTTTGGVSTNQTGTNNTLNNNVNNSTSSGSSSNTNNTSVNGTSSQNSATNPFTVTSSGSTSGNTSSNSKSTGVSSNTQTGSGTNNSTQNSTGSQNGTNTQNQNGGNAAVNQTVATAPMRSRTKQRGPANNAAATLAYKGLGDYQNFAIPISDISFLHGLVYNYFLLSGVSMTANIREANTIVYVTVDVFGTIRSRFDSVIYNSENIVAETGMEIFAFDKAGKLIMKPQSSNYEAEYGERYILWSGPFESSKEVKKSNGLLVDFSDVKPGKRDYDVEKKQKTPFKIPGFQ